MNKQDRKQLEKALEMIENARAIIYDLSEAEQGKFDNLPDNLQTSERGEKYQETATELEEIASELEDIESRLIEII